MVRWLPAATALKSFKIVQLWVFADGTTDLFSYHSVFRFCSPKINILFMENILTLSGNNKFRTSETFL